VTDRQGFLERLRLADAGPGRRWASAPGGERIPRGLLGAQSVVAAGATTDTRWRWVHAVHLTYAAEGDPDRGVTYQVEDLHDTEHTTTRLVHATQGETVLVTAAVGFQVPRRGLGPTHQEPEPGELPDPHALAARTRAGTGPIDVRHLDRAPWEPAADATAASRMWLRFTEEIPDRILLHAAALVHAADLLLVEPVAPDPGGDLARQWTDLDTGRGLAARALDLSVRFHRGFRADDWLLHVHRSPSLADYRAFTTGEFFSSGGRLVASVSQETALVPVGDGSVQEEVAGAASAVHR
jgi:acyl-CoA thioesterase-2